MSVCVCVCACFVGESVCKVQTYYRFAWGGVCAFDASQDTDGAQEEKMKVETHTLTTSHTHTHKHTHSTTHQQTHKGTKIEFILIDPWCRRGIFVVGKGGGYGVKSHHRHRRDLG
jgi:hypothetical protein